MALVFNPPLSATFYDEATGKSLGTMLMAGLPHPGESNPAWIILEGSPYEFGQVIINAAHRTAFIAVSPVPTVDIVGTTAALVKLAAG